MHNIWLVARREYLERVRAKSFLIMTILIPLLMGGAIGGVAFMSRNMGSGQHIAVVTDNPQFASDIQTEMSDSKGTNKPTVDIYPLSNPTIFTTLNDQLAAKHATLDGYLIVTPAVTTGQRPTFQWVPKVESDVITRARVADAIRGALTREKLITSGMSTAQVDSLLAPIELNSKGKSDHAGAAVASAYGMFFLMYFVILFYGMNVARSIIEEKTSRIFEVLLATVKPTEMLAGKVIGVGAVGLSQVAIWITLALVAVKYMSASAGFDMHILPNAGQSALFILFFILGYLLYSSIAAALGAMTNSEQELQQMQIFLMLPLIFCSMIIFQVITNPDGTVAKWASFVPFTAPLIMYTRVIVGHPDALAV